MKRYLLLAVLWLVALSATADRFYIEDFEITPGETMMVSTLLENEVSYTAFQTDIYLPEGLTVEQEDGDYIFDLTSRKSRDHIIASQVQADGAIRVISYSNKINAYSGNSGALVTFNVIASTDFVGPASIQLKNIRFTTTVGTEVSFFDEQCNVTTAFNNLKGDVNNDGFIGIADVTAIIDYLLSHDASNINLENADIDENAVITIGDATALTDILLNN